jgi:hypothetical protein
VIGSVVGFRRGLPEPGVSSALWRAARGLPTSAPGATPSPSPVPSPTPGGGPALPLVVSREDAQRAAADELAKPAYARARPGLLERALSWLGHQLTHWLDRAFSSGGTGSGHGWIALAVLIAVLAVVLVVIRLRYGPLRRAAKAERSLFDEAAPLDAAGYRKAAEAFAAEGAWAEAVRARLRAIITGLQERTVLDPRPGRTADGAAREAGAALPDQADALCEAARIFDDIWYGEATASAAEYRRVAAIDDAVAAARPRVGASASAAASSSSSASGSASAAGR